MLLPIRGAFAAAMLCPPMGPASHMQRVVAEHHPAGAEHLVTGSLDHVVLTKRSSHGLAVIARCVQYVTALYNGYLARSVNSKVDVDRPDPLPSSQLQSCALAEVLKVNRQALRSQ